MTLVDNVRPILSGASDVTVNTPATASGGQASWTVTCNDNVNGSITPICSASSGDTFLLGVTDVTCNCTDGQGNFANASFQVTVIGNHCCRIIRSDGLK